MKTESSLGRRIMIAGSVVMVGIAGNAFTPFAPSIIGALVDYLEFSLEAAGRLTSLEFGATSLGVLVSTLCLHRPELNLKRISFFCVSILIVCNVATVFSYDNPALFSACRFVSGFVAGITWCAAAISVSRVQDVERASALLYGSPYFMGALGLTFLPMIYPYYGVSGAYYTIILICITALPFLLAYYPEDTQARSTNTDTVTGAPEDEIPWLALGIILLALFINYAANSGIWSYFERLGVSYGHTAATVGPVVGASQLMALAGVFFATVLGSRLGEIKPILAGTTLLALSTLLLFYSSSLVVFFCSTAIFNFSITLLTPYYFVLLSRITPSGRGVLWGNLILWLGFASGPALVSVTLQDSDFKLSIILTMVGFIISILLILLYQILARQALTATGNGTFTDNAFRQNQ